MTTNEKPKRKNKQQKRFQQVVIVTTVLSLAIVIGLGTSIYTTQTMNVASTPNVLCFPTMSYGIPERSVELALQTALDDAQLTAMVSVSAFSEDHICEDVDTHEVISRDSYVMNIQPEITLFVTLQQLDNPLALQDLLEIVLDKLEESVQAQPEDVLMAFGRGDRVTVTFVAHDHELIWQADYVDVFPLGDATSEEIFAFGLGN